MRWYLVESYDYVVEHNDRRSEGVVAEASGSEKIYLHVIAFSDEEQKQLKPRVDEEGNQQHDRLALPRNEEWWVAVDGEAFWPRVFRPKMRSFCTDIATAPCPAPLSPDDLARLRKSGKAKDLPESDPLG